MPRTASISDTNTKQTRAFQPNRRQMRDIQAWRSLSPNQAYDVLFNWLLSSSTNRMELAIEIFLGIGAPAVPVLVQAVLQPRKSAAQRIRILELIEKIGIPLGVAEFFDLHDLLHRCTRPVQIRIVQLFTTLRSAGSQGDLDRTPITPIATGQTLGQSPFAGSQPTAACPNTKQY